MSSPSGPAGVFDRAAATYDAVGVPYFAPIAAGLVAALAPQPGERALDVGCGRGAVLTPVARLVGPSGSAVGIDLAPEMVRRTAADLADLGQVEVLLGDAAAPAFAARSFDLVASSLVLFFLDEPAAALRRWRGAAGPGRQAGRDDVRGRGPAVARDRRGLRAVPAGPAEGRAHVGHHGPVRLRRRHGGTCSATPAWSRSAPSGTRCTRGSATSSTCSRSRGRTVSGSCGRPSRPGRATRSEPRSWTARPSWGCGPDGFTLTQDVRYTLGRRPVRPGG